MIESSEQVEVAYVPAPPKMSEQTVSQGKAAPELRVRYSCPHDKCDGECITNAYMGPPSCAGKPDKPHRKVWMVALGIEREVL